MRLYEERGRGCACADQARQVCRSDREKSQLEAYGGLQTLRERQTAGSASLEELNSEETVLPGKIRAG